MVLIRFRAMKLENLQLYSPPTYCAKIRKFA